jgi:hypothetical protein
MASPGISGKKIPAYVHNLVTGTNITFKFYPEEVEDTHSSSFSQKEILGRSTPLLAYSGGGPREVSFSVILHDDFCDDGIINTVNKLKGLTYPEYDSGVVPPECYVRLGSSVYFTGQCTNVSVSWQPPFRSIRDDNSTYTRADVSMSFLVGHEKAKSASEVERRGD